MRRYVIVSPVRDEEQYLESTIQGVIRQTVLPAEWIIVNDGSSDNTGRIAECYAKSYPWIRVVHRDDRGRRVPGSGVVEAFYDGYRRLVFQDWDFVVKLDGDVGLDPDYFEQCFERFKQDPLLGICGGVMYCMIDGKLQRESHPMFHVRGPIKLYKRSCWNGIGGLIQAAGWDTVDEVQANRLGWRTKTFADLKVIHQRPTGAALGAWKDGVKMGRAAYICGYHPLFMAAKFMKRLFARPYFISALSHGYGFISSYWKRVRRVEDPDLIRYLRSQQLRRLLLLDSIWK
jgi:biofilm PGA synthesis N-glycosyltransferase PgaC